MHIIVSYYDTMMCTIVYNSILSIYYQCTLTLSKLMLLGFEAFLITFEAIGSNV